jgi:predicted small secreted protein
MVQKIILSALITLYLIALIGCHTMHGVGKDIESAGESIQKATDKMEIEIIRNI